MLAKINKYRTLLRHLIVDILSQLRWSENSENPHEKTDEPLPLQLPPRHPSPAQYSIVPIGTAT
jgi:hypothetical protein